MNVAQFELLLVFLELHTQILLSEAVRAVAIFRCRLDQPKEEECWVVQVLFGGGFTHRASYRVATPRIWVRNALPEHGATVNGKRLQAYLAGSTRGIRKGATGSVHDMSKLDDVFGRACVLLAEVGGDRFYLNYVKEQGQGGGYGFALRHLIPAPPVKRVKMMSRYRCGFINASTNQATGQNWRLTNGGWDNRLSMALRGAIVSAGLDAEIGYAGGQQPTMHPLFTRLMKDWDGLSFEPNY